MLCKESAELERSDMDFEEIRFVTSCTFYV